MNALIGSGTRLLGKEHHRKKVPQGSEHGTTMVSTSPAPANLSEDTFTQEPSQVLDDSNDLTLPDISLSGSNELPGLAHDLPQHQQQSVMNENFTVYELHRTCWWPHYYTCFERE
uniref:Uncharacterized protein n=1 Tax=Fusarium oxysporum (strain Fo5176) TaxID=660025 RepID=A0A0D2Y3S2_FUSOF